jgi:hypothetical protein
MGEVDAARKLYEEVIEGETAQLGGSHTSTLTTKGNLVVVLTDRQQGYYSTYEQTLSIKTRLGPHTHY